MKTPRLLALILLAGGPAMAAPAADEYLKLRTQDRSVSVHVTEDNLSSPQLQLSLQNDTVRGRAFNHPVNITTDNDTLRGVYGQGPVKVDVTDHEDTLQAEGTFGGKLVSFQVSPHQITGTVGACTYELIINRHRDLYEGWRSCGDKMDRKVTLDIPSSLADNEEELVTALSILLAQ